MFLKKRNPREKVLTASRHNRGVWLNADDARQLARLDDVNFHPAPQEPWQVKAVQEDARRREEDLKR